MLLLTYRARGMISNLYGKKQETMENNTFYISLYDIITLIANDKRRYVILRHFTYRFFLL